MRTLSMASASEALGTEDPPVMDDHMWSFFDKREGIEGVRKFLLEEEGKRE